MQKLRNLKWPVYSGLISKMGKKVETSERILQGQNLERLVSQAEECRSDLAGTRDSGLKCPTRQGPLASA